MINLVKATEKALEDLYLKIEKNAKRKQAEKGLDGLSYFVRCKLTDDRIPNAEEVSAKIREAFGKHPGWKDGFNDELLGMPKELGDYVIVHELMHFALPNHGKLWKSLMRAHLGEYEEAEKRLKTYAQSSGSSPSVPLGPGHLR